MNQGPKSLDLEAAWRYPFRCFYRPARRILRWHSAASRSFPLRCIWSGWLASERVAVIVHLYARLMRPDEMVLGVAAKTSRPPLGHNAIRWVFAVKYLWECLDSKGFSCLTMSEPISSE